RRAGVCQTPGGAGGPAPPRSARAGAPPRRRWRPCSNSAPWPTPPTTARTAGPPRSCSAAKPSTASSAGCEEEDSPQRHKGHQEDEEGEKRPKGVEHPSHFLFHSFVFLVPFVSLW